MAADPGPISIEAALAGYVPRERAPGDLRRAAVLVPLRRNDAGVIEVVFTLRPEAMRQHGGQPSFPGGGLEPGDTGALDAALRETEEELGVSRDAVTPIGRLDDMMTVTRFHISPWVGWLDAGAELSPSPAEVAAVFTIPLAGLADPALRRTMVSRWRDRPARLDFFLAGPHVVWGASARIVANLLEVLER